MFCNFLDCSHVVCLYKKSVRVCYLTRLQSSPTGFLMPDQLHFLSLYSYSLLFSNNKSNKFSEFLCFYVNLFYFIVLLLHKDSLRIVLYNVYFIVSFYWYSRHYRHKTFISFIEIACYVILTLFYTKKKV